MVELSTTSTVMRFLFLFVLAICPSVFSLPLPCNWGATAGSEETHYHNRLGGFQDGVHTTDWCHDGSLMDYDAAKCVPFTSFP